MPPTGQYAEVLYFLFSTPARPCYCAFTGVVLTDIFLGMGVPISLDSPPAPFWGLGALSGGVGRSYVTPTYSIFVVT